MLRGMWNDWWKRGRKLDVEMMCSELVKILLSDVILFKRVSGHTVGHIVLIY